MTTSKCHQGVPASSSPPQEQSLSKFRYGAKQVHFSSETFDFNNNKPETVMETPVHSDSILLSEIIRQKSSSVAYFLHLKHAKLPNSMSFSSYSGIPSFPLHFKHLASPGQKSVARDLNIRLITANSRRTSLLQQKSQLLSLRTSLVAHKVARRKVVDVMRRRHKSVMLSLELRMAGVAREVELKKRVLKNGTVAEKNRRIALLKRAELGTGDMKKMSTFEEDLGNGQIAPQVTDVIDTTINTFKGKGNDLPKDDPSPAKESIVSPIPENSLPRIPTLCSFFRPRESKALTMRMPINRLTLRELDLNRILSNIQIRHALVFDSDMSFKPSSTLVQQIKAKVFWNQVSRELKGYVDPQKTSLPPNYAVVPLIVVEIREVLGELVSEDQHTYREVMEKMDTRWIVQQLKQQGGLDYKALVQFVGSVMLQHCAPCRDVLVHDMLQGAADGSLGLADVLRSCMDILERMKMVIARFLLDSYVNILFEWLGSCQPPH
jgi:hypothetical protein